MMMVRTLFLVSAAVAVKLSDAKIRVFEIVPCDDYSHSWRMKKVLHFVV